MSKFTGIHWFEGQFLRPHHLQAFSDLQSQTLAGEIERFTPYHWGIQNISIAEGDLANFTFAVRELSLRMPGGTLVEVPGTAEIEPRNFQDALSASGGALNLLLGVPRLTEGSPNATGIGQAAKAGVRYLVQQMEVTDQNTGSNPQPIEVRKLAARIFFDGDNTAGYDTIRIARIRRSGTSENLPVLAPEFAPPLLSLAAWPKLASRVSDLAQRLTAITRASASSLMEPGTGKVRPAAGLLDLIRLQTAASFAPLLGQLISTPGIHPYPVFLELVRLAGQLALFGDLTRSASLPAYEHDNLATSFGNLIERVDRLLTDVAAPSFESVRLTENAGRLEGPLEPSWMETDSKIFLGVESEYTHAQVDGMVAGAKVGSPEDLPLFLQRRLPGLKLERVTHVPGDLPDRPELVYYRIETQGEFWDNVAKTKAVGVAGLTDTSLKVTVFVLPGV